MRSCMGKRCGQSSVLRGYRASVDSYRHRVGKDPGASLHVVADETVQYSDGLRAERSVRRRRSGVVLGHVVASRQRADCFGCAGAGGLDARVGAGGDGVVHQLCR